MERIVELNDQMNALMLKGFNTYPKDEWNNLFVLTYPEYKKDFTEEHSIMYSTIIARSVVSMEDKNAIEKMIEFFIDENLDDGVSYNQRQRLASLTNAMLMRQSYDYQKKLWEKYKDKIDVKKTYPPSFCEVIRELKYCWSKLL
jgi:hypothetical protein